MTTKTVAFKINSILQAKNVLKSREAYNKYYTFSVHVLFNKHTKTIKNNNNNP